MVLGLYRQPITRTQIKGEKWMYVKILICSKYCWKNPTSATASSHMSSIFLVNLVFFNLATFFCPRTTFNCFNFQHIISNNTNNHLSVLFRPLVSSAKDTNFQSTLVFYQVLLKNVIRVLQYI